MKCVVLKKDGVRRLVDITNSTEMNRLTELGYKHCGFEDVVTTKPSGYVSDPALRKAIEELEEENILDTDTDIQ